MLDFMYFVKMFILISTSLNKGQKPGQVMCSIYFSHQLYGSLCLNYTFYCISSGPFMSLQEY